MLKAYYIFLLFVMVSLAPPRAVADTKTTSSSVATEQLTDAHQLIAEKNWPQALAALRAIVDAKSFASLPDDFRYKALQIAGGVATYHGPPKQGYQYLGRVIAMPQADYGDWLERLRLADQLGIDADSVIALTAMMQRWPDRTMKLDSDFILKIANEAKSLPSHGALPLLQALYAAHWKLQWDLEPSSLWRDLTLLLLEKNQLAAANDVAGHVTDSYVLIAMRSDRRFDAVVAANAAQFDIPTASEREFQSFQAAAEKSPQSLALKSWVVESLLRQRHYEGALAAADSTLLDIQSTNSPTQLFSDYEETRSWFLNQRSIALQRVGRWDEAVEQMAAASLLNEKYSGNVDQLTNLGYLYCELGRPEEALAAIGRMAAATSPYGAMLVEAVRVDAAYQLGDSKQVERSLQYLRAHHTDAPGVYVDALIIVNQLDRAARELVADLNNAAARQYALLSVQAFAPTPGTPRDADEEARRRAVIARPDVQAAIRKVGRVESYALEAE